MRVLRRDRKRDEISVDSRIIIRTILQHFHQASKSVTVTLLASMEAGMLASNFYHQYWIIRGGITIGRVRQAVLAVALNSRLL